MIRSARLARRPQPQRIRTAATRSSAICDHIVATVASWVVELSSSSIAPSITGGYSTGKSWYGTPWWDDVMLWKRRTSPVNAACGPNVASWLSVIGTAAIRAPTSPTASSAAARRPAARRTSVPRRPVVSADHARRRRAAPIHDPRGAPPTPASSGSLAPARSFGRTYLPLIARNPHYQTWWPPTL